MYVNKCTKCGKEFETKNPKRVICPDCLYPERKGSEEQAPQQERMSYYSTDSGEDNRRNNYNNRDNRGGYGGRDGGYNRDNRGGGYGGRDGGYNRDNRGGGYNRDNRGGGYNRDNRGGGYNNNRGGGYNRDNRGGGFNRGGGRPKPQRKPQPKKQLLVNKEQLAQIEELYKTMLPLPNHDAHEVIGAQIGLEPRKVFFGINLIRQKMMLPKLPFPKRKLAVSPDQLTAIKMLYEPLLPLPPIGCHKIIAVQLKMDEWRVHVGIGIIRKQLGLDRWNQDREDAPEEYKKAK